MDFTWVKTYDDNYWNELADHLMKEAACGSDDITYIKIPKSAVTSELKEKLNGMPQTKVN